MKPTHSLSLQRAQMAQHRMLRQRTRRLGDERSGFHLPAEPIELDDAGRPDAGDGEELRTMMTCQ